MRVGWLGLVCAPLLVAGACGGDDEPSNTSQHCTLGDPASCAAGLVCEPWQGMEPTCTAPLEVHGRVISLTDGSPVQGATVVALDVNGGARSSVTLSGADGHYVLPVPLQRDAEGLPVQDFVQLNVAAAGYQPFPRAPRTALPVDLSLAQAQTDPDGHLAAHVVKSTATDVGLLKLADTAQGTISGRIDHPQAGGALVVAVQQEVAVSTAIADLAGNFTVFNVPASTTELSAFRAGLRVEALQVQANGEIRDVVLSATEGGTSTVVGSVNMADARGDAETSVILALESTFDTEAARGQSPMGLRVGPVGGAFEISDVPPGRYVVLAAFENDALVQDPDQSISGTDIVHLEVPEGGGEVVLDDSFKITSALATHSPGAEGLEELSVGESIEFVWGSDSSEDGYELRIYDAFGTLIHENTELPGVTGSKTASYRHDSAEFEPGMIYQFRVWSWSENRNGRTYLSRTEDLRGAFQIAAPTEEQDP